MSYCGCSSKKKDTTLDNSILSLFRGGRVVMPSEYYGVESGRYSASNTNSCMKGGKRKSKRRSRKGRKTYKKK